MNDWRCCWWPVTCMMIDWCWSWSCSNNWLLIDAVLVLKLLQQNQYKKSSFFRASSLVTYSTYIIKHSSVAMKIRFYFFRLRPAAPFTSNSKTENRKPNMKQLQYKVPPLNMRLSLNSNNNSTVYSYSY